MGITEDTVERQVSNGVRLLRKALQRHGASPLPDALPRVARLKALSK
jgi:hypothetical protein